MKKYVLLCFVLLIISTNMSAQVYHMRNKYENIPTEILNNIDKMGMDECLFLTELEGKYFNALSNIDEEEFNFCGKKVAFFKGNVGSIKINKKIYFINERARLKVTDYSCIDYFGVLYIFNAEQKAESGGYDAAIVYVSKKLNSIEEVIKRLKNQR
ncbi:hypothetical protein FACS1894123_08880 [Bacteroidia bacterium]|nr:hypothetical protein FACS1894123_08880 [Bacteroidia bacterium]